MDAFRDLLGLVYLVDAADHEWFAVSKAELGGLLATEDVTKAPVSLLKNRNDHYTVVSLEEPREQLGLVATTGKGEVLSGESEQEKGVRSIEVFICRATKRLATCAGVGSVGHRLTSKEGYDAAFVW